MRAARLTSVITGMVLAACTCSTPSRAQTLRDPSAQLRAPLGTNLDFLADWSSAMPFVDLMKTSRPWISGTMVDFEGGGPLDLDARGWPRTLRPGQVARTLMVWDMTTHPAGRYVVTWQGRGHIDYFGGAADRLVAAESRPQRDVLDIDPRRDGAGIGLTIVRTDPDDPIRDIHVFVPGGACSGDDHRWCDDAHPCGDAGTCEPFERIHERQIFHPHFLRSLEPYSAIRFMNWADANSTVVPGSFERTWGDRTEVADIRWAPRAPLEIMIELANRMHAEPWISLPYAADDDYARRAGALFRERLDPSLRVWVEYSNEVWNTMFPQAEFCEQQGVALGLDSDPELASIRFASRRTGQLHAAFAEGLGGRDRMIRVYAGQAASSWRNEQLLDFEGAASRADVLAIAPYFGTTVMGEHRAEWARMSVDQFFARAQRESLVPVREMVQTSARIARERNLALVAYEGGQHYVAYGPAQDDERIVRLLDRANRDPRMEQLYTRYLDLWRELSGGGLMMHHVDISAWGRFGYWGASEYLGQPLEQTPKRRALLRFVERTRHGS